MKAFLMIGVAALALSGQAIAADKALGIQGDGLYSFETSASQKNGVIGGDLENITAQEIKIVRAESSVAKRVELHTHLMEDGVMMMREVGSYAVGAGDEFELGPRAEHLMLMGLKAPLKQGDVFSVRFFDADGASIEVPVLVRAAGDIPDDDHDHEEEETKHDNHDHHDHHGHEH